VKCVKFLQPIPETGIKVGDYYRTDNQSADSLVKQGCADYASRSSWRDFWDGISKRSRSDGYLKVPSVKWLLKRLE
jgi:hypothetical protein